MENQSSYLNNAINVTPFIICNDWTNIEIYGAKFVEEAEENLEINKI